MSDPRIPPRIPPLRRHHLVALAVLAVIGLPPLFALVLLEARFVLAWRRDLSFGHATQMLYLWQGVLGAALAIVAAGVGAAAVVMQTSAARRLDDQRRARRARALWAASPLSLSAVCDYATACVRELEKGRAVLDAELDAAPRPPVDLVAPPLPADLTPGFVGIIETSPEPEGEALSTLLRELQVQHARIASHCAVARGEGRRNAILLRHNFDSGVCDAAVIHARASALFDFARGETTGLPGPLSGDNLLLSLRIMLGEVPDGVRDLIAKRERVWAESGRGARL
jgi:hypothetical protein